MSPNTPCRPPPPCIRILGASKYSTEYYVNFTVSRYFEARHFCPPPPLGARKSENFIHCRSLPLSSTANLVHTVISHRPLQKCWVGPCRTLDVNCLNRGFSKNCPCLAPFCSKFADFVKEVRSTLEFLKFLKDVLPAGSSRWVRGNPNLPKAQD